MDWLAFAVECLWLVHWTLTDAGGSLSSDTDGDGTTVRMLVPTGQDT